ncbi:PaaI family thioesterase [Pectobacteriaceae bacterium CE70]|nr:PaaI family thioesterase [Serratia sp. ATCC 39006]WJV63609.1 PaaI family thioesterase [Pectobacteriaceae bacterium C52]WJV68001.1 PaaI family thioesterase [Pectobacteriaceae bacterium CE70]WJY11942.1 PaaI family thioesterase [Pectobacteriaceae bacterium C80]
MNSLYTETKKIHAQCIACGEPAEGQLALGLVFREMANGAVTTDFLVTPEHQGYPGLLHGGLISTLLDATMTNCLFSRGIHALTVELLVRFSTPIPVGSYLSITSWVLSQRKNIFRLESTICFRGELKHLARATAKFMAVPQAFFYQK